MFSKWLQQSACVARESVNTFSFFTYLGTGGYLEDTGCFLSNIPVHLARCNGSLSQEYLLGGGALGHQWAETRVAGLRAGCLGGHAGPNPNLLPGSSHVGA